MMPPKRTKNYEAAGLNVVKPTIRHLVTVSWCNAPRGLLCSKDGAPVGHGDGHQMTTREIFDELGPFWTILDPMCEPFTKQEVAEYTKWRPLDEYKGQFGIAYTDQGDKEYIYWLTHPPTS